MPTLQESLLYWSAVSQEAELVVFSTLLAFQHLHCRADGWNLGEGQDLPGDLRLVGGAAAPGPRHPGSGLLLGLYEGQPAAPELHIDESPEPAAAPSSRPTRQEEGWF